MLRLSTFFGIFGIMPRKKAYHHGNLRPALLRAAVRLIAKSGPDGFTLREVARRAGVSHNAPYRHFRSKKELLAEVAAQGFEEMRAAMLEAAELEASALGRLRRSGWAYVAFALRRKEHFTVMFETSLEKTDHPEMAEAAGRTFQALVQFVEECQEEGAMPPLDAERAALLAWSQVHGIAKLALTGQLPFRSDQEVLDFTDWALSQPPPPAPNQ